MTSAESRGFDPGESLPNLSKKSGYSGFVTVVIVERRPRETRRCRRDCAVDVELVCGSVALVGLGGALN